MQLQSALISVTFILALTCGGILSAKNAANVQHEYINKYDCAAINDLPDDEQDGFPRDGITEQVCHDLENLRNRQATSAVSSPML